MSWAPRDGNTRQKDLSRANARAKKLRADQTPSERALWKILRQLNREGASFRRQAAMGNLVFDFVDFGARLLIELDGGVHDLPEVARRDETKATWAASQGFCVLRLTNAEVWSAPDATFDELRAPLSADRPPPLAPPHKGEGNREAS